MSHVLDVPDDLYSKVAEYAEEQGQTVDELLLEYMRNLVRRPGSNEGNECVEATVADPLAPFIGAFNFGVGDLAENHDQYLARRRG